MENLAYYIKFLELKSPVELTFKTKSNKHDDAFYLPKFNNRGNLKAHKIVVFLGNQDVNSARTVDELVAHELIHAWQQENKIQEFHGPNFIMQAIAMKHAFDLPNIYLAELDSEF
jgi:hypothetical protein